MFAGDVMGTGYHAVEALDLEPGGSVAVLGLGPVGLCAVQVAKAAGADEVIAVDSVEERLAMAESFGATPVHLTEDDVRGAVKQATEGRGVDGAIDAVGHPAGARHGLPPGPQGGHGLGDRRLLRARSSSTWGSSGSSR